MKNENPYIKHLFLLVFILAFLVRFVGPDPWYANLDSFLYYTNALKIFEGRLTEVELHEWPVGYPAVMSVFFIFFGACVRTATMVSAVFGSLTVVLAYLLGKELFEEETGLFAAALVALSPEHVYLSSTIMSDATGVFFLCLTMYFLLRYLKGGKDVFLYLTSASAAAAFIVQYINMILLPLVFLTAFYWGRRSVPIKTLLACLVLSALVIAPQLYFNNLKFGEPLTFGFLTHLSDDSLSTLSLSNMYTTGYLRNIPPILHYPYIVFLKPILLPPYLALFYFIALIHPKGLRKRRELFFIVSWIVLFSASIMLTRYHDTPSRFSLTFLVPLAVLASFALTSTVNSLVKEKRGRVAATILLLLSATSLVNAFWLKSDRLRVHGVEDLMQSYVREHTEEDGVVLASPHHLGDHVKPVLGRSTLDLRVALAGGFENPDPAVEWELERLNDSRSPKQKLEALFSENPRLYVLVSAYGNQEPENFDVLEEYAQLTLLKEEDLRLSMMSPWRAYTIAVYKVSGLKHSPS